MQRRRLFHTSVIYTLALGSIASGARAQTAPSLCPSSSYQAPSATTPAAPPAAAAQKKTAANTSTPKKLSVDSGKIDITSDHATIGLDGNATLQGNVSIRQGDRHITANEAHFNSKTNDVKTDSGGVEYEDPLMRVTGEGGSYSPAAGADFRAAQFELLQRAARGSADKLRLTPQGVLDLEGVTYTTCPAAAPAWRMKASRITLDTRDKLGTGRSARVEFEGVPLVYLPWVSFPLGNERKSGFLFPSLGVSSRSGFILQVPYYWNIAPNLDFTFEPMEYTRRGTDLGGDFRYLTENQHGELSWNYLPDDDVYRKSRSRVKLTHVTELPDDFRFTIDAQNVSDTSYFEDFAQAPEGTSTAFVERRALLTYRDEHWRIDGEAQNFQTIDNTLDLADRPYTRVPRLAVDSDFGLGPGGRLHYGFSSEVVNFQRSVGVTGWRMDLLPEISYRLDGAGYFVRPSLAWRATQYELSDGAPGQDRSPARTLPIASFDTGLFFERDAGSHDQRRLTLEPRVMYLYVPYRQQDGLPLFDTALPDLDPVQLFRSNRYVGADRVGDANQVSVAVTSRLLDAHDGRQFLAATLGETYYFADPHVVLPDEEVRTDRRSDIVAQVSLSAFQDWSADVALQWDPQTSRSERSHFNIQYKPGPERVINVGYSYERGLIEQAEVSGAWPVARNWNVFARGVYSIEAHQALERFAGFEYRACCWRLRLGARRFVSRRPLTADTEATGPEDTALWLQLELNGLAGVGSATDTFLTEAIRGYSPAETK